MLTFIDYMGQTRVIQTMRDLKTKKSQQQAIEQHVENRNIRELREGRFIPKSTIHFTSSRGWLETAIGPIPEVLMDEILMEDYTLQFDEKAKTFSDIKPRVFINKLHSERNDILRNFGKVMMGAFDTAATADQSDLGNIYITGRRERQIIAGVRERYLQGTRVDVLDPLYISSDRGIYVNPNATAGEIAAHATFGNQEKIGIQVYATGTQKQKRGVMHYFWTWWSFWTSVQSIRYKDHKTAQDLDLPQSDKDKLRIPEEKLVLPSILDVAEYTVRLIQLEYSSAHFYFTTIRDVLIADRLIEHDKFFDFEAARLDKIIRNAVKHHEADKATVVRASKLKLLTKEHRAIAIFLLHIGKRIASVATSRPTHNSDRTYQQYVGAVVTKRKVPCDPATNNGGVDWCWAITFYNDKNVLRVGTTIFLGCGCIRTTRTQQKNRRRQGLDGRDIRLDDQYCVICNPDNSIEHLQLPIPIKTIDTINKVVGASYHSWRVTNATCTACGVMAGVVVFVKAKGSPPGEPAMLAYLAGRGWATAHLRQQSDIKEQLSTMFQKYSEKWREAAPYAGDLPICCGCTSINFVGTLDDMLSFQKLYNTQEETQKLQLQTIAISSKQAITYEPQEVEAQLQQLDAARNKAGQHKAPPTATQVQQQRRQVRKEGEKERKGRYSGCFSTGTQP